MALVVTQLEKSFAAAKGPVRALQGVSLTANPGDFLAIQGPSGCGKTTLLLALGGLLRPDAGGVQLNGDDPYRLSPEARGRFRARHVGFVFQQYHLVPYLSVIDNVLAPTLAAPVADASRRAAELLARFKLTDRADHRPDQLSAGEKQRAALARALIHEPSLLLADEPTGNLDRENAAVILDAMSRFAERGGIVVLVTHDPVAASHARSILRMNEGRLVRSETHGPLAAARA